MPPVAPAAGRAPGAAAPPGAVGARVEVSSVEALGPEGPRRFAVRLPRRSMDVVRQFDRQMAAAGWRRFRPRLAVDPGTREWVTVRGATVGPADLYQAAWRDPKTGRLAVLDLWHDARRPEWQEGSFELREPEEP